MLVLMTVTLWTSVFLLPQNFVHAVECEDMTIKFLPRNLLALRDCTSILGSLTIGSVVDYDNIEDINKFQFPNLTEITGFLVIYHAPGLDSIGNLFPNLMVIRGKRLLLSFALVIFDNLHLKSIDLKSLITIQRGFVLIQRCPTLCLHDTINWEALTDENEEVTGGQGNIIQPAPLDCPTRQTCRACENHNCWSPLNCQKDKSNQLQTVDGIKCHRLCLGGCVNSTAEGCYVCLTWKLDGKCVDECPSDLFSFRSTMRCITREKCISAYNMIPFKNECRKQCPVSFSQYHPTTKKFHTNECFKCEIKCPNVCQGMEIQGPTELEHFRECHIVEGSLSIRIGFNMTDVYQQLEENLGNIEEINGALKIYRSFGLTSLSFFRNLNKINAHNATLTVERDGELEEYQNPYALEITENENLQTLFDWREKQHIEIIGGGISIHYNSKLCMSEIHNLQNIATYNQTNDHISKETNGYDEVCHATGIYAFHVVDSHSDVRIYWNITDYGSDRRLIGYFVYYIEAPSHNITYTTGLDACSTKNVRPTKYNDMPMISSKIHSDFWQSIFVPFEDLKQEKGYFETNVTNLKQFTQYAYYVRTQLSLKIRDQLINVTQGQSQVKYFVTLPDRPRPPIVRTREKTNVSITLEWIPSTPEHQLIEKYIIDVYALEDDVNEIDERNYCHDPKETIEKVEDVAKFPEAICCRDERAYLDFFQRNGNQTCGQSDPACEKTFKFVLFHHHVETALLTADLAKDPSERYQYKVVSYDSPVQRKNGSDGSKYYLHSHIIDDERTDNIVVPNLKPFHLYAFYVYACNSVANCSNYYFHSDRTQPYVAADDVRVVIPDEQRSNVVTLVIQPPVQPNAVTVSYEIESYDNLRNYAKVECITRLDMEAKNYTIRFENLLHGTHSFRVRSLSIGENGNFNDWIQVEVEQESNNKYTWTIVVTFICVIILVIVVTIVCRKLKPYRSRSRQVSDIVYLLPKRRAGASSSNQLQELQDDGDESQQQEAAAFENIQLDVFKSNVDVTLPTDQSTTIDQIPENVTGEGPSSPPSTSPRKALTKLLFESLPKTDALSQQIELDDMPMKEPLLASPSETEETESPLTKNKYDFSFFPPF